MTIRTKHIVLKSNTPIIIVIAGWGRKDDDKEADAELYITISEYVYRPSSLRPKMAWGYERLYYLDTFPELQTTKPNNRFTVGWSSANPGVNSLDNWADQRYVPCWVNVAISQFCLTETKQQQIACWIKRIHPSHKLKVKLFGVCVGKLWKNCIKKFETFDFHNSFHRSSPGWFTMIGNTHVKYFY